MLTFLSTALTDVTTNTDILKTLIEYGLLGVIAFAFLKQNARQQDILMNNFQTMINQIVKTDDNTDDFTNILQSVQSHNLNSVKMMDEILSKISIEQENRELLIEMVNDYNALIRELKTAIIKIKNNNTSKNQARLIGEILISEGYITKEELEICLKIQSNKDLNTLDELSKPLDKKRN